MSEEFQIDENRKLVFSYTDKLGYRVSMYVKDKKRWIYVWCRSIDNETNYRKFIKKVKITSKKYMSFQKSIDALDSKITNDIF